MNQQPPSPERHALDLLRADHVRVKTLFRDVERLRGDADDGSHQRMAALVDDICYELTVHGMAEQELFYPAVRAAGGDPDLLDEAEAGHAGICELVAQLEVMYPGDDHFNATVTVLVEEVQHHIDQEESGLFAAARAGGIDLVALGRELAARRQALDDDLSAPPGSTHAMQPRAPN